MFQVLQGFATYKIAPVAIKSIKILELKYYCATTVLDGPHPAHEGNWLSIYNEKQISVSMQIRVWNFSVVFPFQFSSKGGSWAEIHDQLAKCRVEDTTGSVQS